MKTPVAGFVLISFAVGVCATVLAAPGEDATFIIVRHAEKRSDDGSDPALSPAGRRRAAALAQRLASHKLIAVYTTPYRRTQETGLPAAQARGFKITSYSPHQPAAELARVLRQAHPTGAVLVVGHSNTAPEIAAVLCDCKVAPLDEQDYDRLFIVRVDGTGRAELTQERY